MSKARLVIAAVTVEKRPVSEIARCYGVARSWIYAVLARYRDEGEAAFEQRSRRPTRSPPPGLVTLRRNGRLHHIGIGRPHAGTRVLLLVQDLHIRVINAHTGELLRELTLNPTRNYQPTGRPSGWPNKTTRPLRGFAVSSMS
jgi:transposase